MTRRLALALFAAASLAAGMPAPASALELAGLADQHPEDVVDQRVTELGMRGARVLVRWNAALADPAPVDAWLAAARQRGLEPLIVFNQSAGNRCPNSPCVLPSVAEYTAAFRAFRQRWPAVTLFAPWNEANVRSQPPWNNPKRAAEYYNVMVANCQGCTILGAEVLDSTDAPSYLKAMMPYMTVAPPAWGVHNYEDINHFRTKGTDAILSTVPGPIWLTEAAALVRYVDGSGKVTYPYDEQRAARAVSFLFDYVESHPRVARLYLYEWRSRGPNDTFDTGLLRADGFLRPAYFIVAERLRKLFPPRVPVAPVAAPRLPFPLKLSSRRIRLGRRSVVVGPLRCLVGRPGRCAGRLELRRPRHRRPLGTRRFTLAGGRSARASIRVSPKMMRRLRRGKAGTITLKVRLTAPHKAARSYGRLSVRASRRRR